LPAAEADDQRIANNNPETRNRAREDKLSFFWKGMDYFDFDQIFFLFWKGQIPD
jgi:hypothetical protein